MLKKLIIVYNSSSSHHAAIEREVLAPARKLSGWLVGKYEVRPVDADENARRLAKLLNDGDLVIAAGGDGTAAVAANGILLSEKDATLSVLGYGNFNDMAWMLKTKRPVDYGGEYIGGVSEIVERFETGKIREIYPLEVAVNGVHWRYAPCYVTVGMFAESTAVFDEAKVREKLKTGKKGAVYSVWQLAKWYFRNRKKDFLPETELARVVEDWRMQIERRVEDDEKVMAEIERKEIVEEVHEKPEKVVEISEEALAEFAKTLAMPEMKLLPATAGKVPKKAKLALAGSRVSAKLLVVGAKSKRKILQVGASSKAKTLAWKHQVGQRALELKTKRLEKQARTKTEQPEIIIDGAEKFEEKQDCPAEQKTVVMASELEGVKLAEKTTDYLAVNGPRIARMMHGGRWYLNSRWFRSTTAKLGGFWSLVWFMMRSIIWRVPGKKVQADILRFETPSTVMIQAEGEYEKLEEVKEIDVVKSDRALKLIKF